MEEEHGPILSSRVSLIWKHQLSQHVLISSDGNWILMLHDRTTVNIKRRHQDVLDMAGV
jgi:hypothetical protein